MDIVVDILLATVCFTGQGVEQCHPVLVGNDTPKGEFQLVQRYTEDPGYGGDVLKFKETKDEIYAIHRVLTLNPKQRRRERLASPNVAERRITLGCINVDEKVYDALVNCCSNSKLIIR